MPACLLLLNAHRAIFFPALASLTLLIGMVLTSPALLAADNDNNRRLENVQLQIQQLTDELAKKRAREDKARNELSRLEKRLDASHRKLAQARQRQTLAKQERQQLIKQRQSIERSIEQDLGLAAQVLRAAYANGHQPALKLLLNQGDPERIARAMGYLSYINRERQKTLEHARSQLDKLADIYANLERSQRDLSGLEQGIKDQIERLQSTRSLRTALVQSLNKSIQRSTNRLAQLKGDEKRLRQLLEQLDSALNDIPADISQRSMRQFRGKLPWPTKGKLLVRYGSTKSDGSLHWNGVMIGAKAGQPVYAIARGRVVFADWLRGQGLLLIVDHGDGLMSLYGHNQSLYKAVGDWINPGELISSVGNTGGQSQPALYFEVRDKGRPKNPKKWCQSIRNNRIR